MNDLLTKLPYDVRRQINMYRLEFRAAISRLVLQKYEKVGKVMPEDIGACAAKVILGDPEKMSPVEELAMRRYHAGRYRFLDDVISELRNELSGSTP